MVAACVLYIEKCRQGGFRVDDVDERGKLVCVDGDVGNDDNDDDEIHGCVCTQSTPTSR